MSSIDRLLLSEVTLPDQHPRSGRHCPVYGFLVHHPDGPVLVDTGVGTGHAELERAYPTIHHPLAAALSASGLEPGDVTLVINTHLHFDHCGNNRLFPDVPLIVQRAEYESARLPRYTIREWIDFSGALWELVDGDAEVRAGLRVVTTPGHTAGHHSVVVDDDSGTQIVAGQAVYDLDELDAEASIEPLEPHEAAATTASARRIKSLRPRSVLFSHDPRIWRPAAV